MNGPTGIFVVSLDFELYWGVRDRHSLAVYRETLLGARQAVPALLELFRQYEIHATWATVGFLFFDCKEELLAALPDVRPQYGNAALSPYGDIDGIGANEAEDPFHFAASLVRKIASTPGQEVATHTFSHYYCLERGQTPAAFRADLDAARRAAARLGVRLESIAFPRNQCNCEDLPLCGELGIIAYRGNQPGRLWRARNQEQESAWVRALRWVDAYFPVSGHGDYALEEGGRAPVNIRASRFLRPYAPALRLLEPLRLRRVTAAMTHAAHHGRVYHLWWHPHNFGRHTTENLAALEKNLAHFAALRDRYGMESLSMSEAAGRALAGARSPEPEAAVLQVSHAG